VPVFHPDVRVWEATDAATGGHIGLFYFDSLARSGKRSGAWAMTYRIQERLDGNVTPIRRTTTTSSKVRRGLRY
jgi:peptidyl-dipeptidase Dcp